MSISTILQSKKAHSLAGLLVFGVAVFIPEPASIQATSLPTSYPLNEAELTANPLDPALQTWFEQHVEQPSAFDLEGKEFTELVAKQDAITQHFLLLGYANRGGSGVDTAKVLLSFEKQLAADAAAKRNLNHPLLPFVYLEMLRAKDVSAETAAVAMAGMRTVGSGSCAEKQLIYDELTKTNLSTQSDVALKQLLKRMGAFRSVNFRKGSLRRFLEALPVEKQNAVTASLLPLAAPYQAILDENDWLKEKAEALSPSGSVEAESEKLFMGAREAARKKRCSTGKDLLIQGLLKTKQPETLQDALATTTSVGNCFRQRSTAMRRDFWHKMEAPLEQAYGYIGQAEARLSLGYLYWAADDFINSKAIFSEVMATAQKLKEQDIESKALFALGRIAENEGDLDSAITMYEDYTKRFPEREHFENALMADVLLRIDRHAWDEALEPLKDLIKAQTMLSVDARSIGALSFALFWSGRIYLEKGQRDQAEEMWRRVASEYYSTYYGAIGHYMLEQVTGRKLALQPSRTPSFKIQSLSESFVNEDKVRVQRIEMLLKLGLKNDSICEIEELEASDGNPEKILFRSLMYYANGEWLNAIKAFDSLPRGFRNSLPVGFERLLFPRRYVDTIHQYAAKAGVDPDLVMAIIRQESVFNPQARSPVGAMGLMQLMPKTAAVEVKRLSSNYISRAEKTLLRKKLHEPRGLLTPEANLIVGIHHVRTLLEKYQNPVYVLSAYNASPSATQRWKNTIPSKDVLAFIERIPYRETRAYVKLVLRNYFYYKRWYDSPLQKLDHLDAVTSPLMAMVKPAEIKPELPPTTPPAAAAEKAIENH